MKCWHLFDLLEQIKSIHVTNLLARVAMQHGLTDSHKHIYTHFCKYNAPRWCTIFVWHHCHFTTLSWVCIVSVVVAAMMPIKNIIRWNVLVSLLLHHNHFGIPLYCRSMFHNSRFTCRIVNVQLFSCPRDFYRTINSLCVCIFFFFYAKQSKSKWRQNIECH